MPFVWIPPGAVPATMAMPPQEVPGLSGATPAEWAQARRAGYVVPPWLDPSTTPPSFAPLPGTAPGLRPPPEPGPIFPGHIGWDPTHLITPGTNYFNAFTVRISGSAGG